MSVNSLLPAIQGVEYGLLSIEAKRQEDSIRAGANAYDAAALQILQGSKLLDFAQRRQPFSWQAKLLVYLMPPLLAILSKRTDLVSDEIRQNFVFLHDHLGTLYQIATAVAAVALVFFGQPLFAISSLVILAIGWMDRNGWLPVTVRQSLHKYSQPVLIATGIFFGGILDRTFAAINFLSFLASHALPEERPIIVESLPEETLDFRTMQDFFRGKINLQLNKKHIHYNPSRPAPLIDIQTLVQQFDQIHWQRHIGPLRQKLQRDPRFIREHIDPSRKTDEQIIQITRDVLQTFVTSVKERRILEGEPRDYDKLHCYLKIIAHSLQNQPDEMARTDALFRLAVEGGGQYCGPGKFEVAESVFTQLVGESPDIPLRDKILYELQTKRNLWVQSIYSVIIQRPPLSKLGSVIDWHDVHSYNFFLNMHGEALGLRKASADNDDTAVIEPILKWIIAYTIQNEITDLFWEHHSTHHIVRAIIESAGTSQLPKSEIYDFWRLWIERQPISDNAKQDVMDDLRNAKLFGQPLEINGKLNEIFVALMLLDMGILQIVSLS